MKKIIVLVSFFICLLLSLNTKAEINIVSWGGAYNEAQKLSFSDPYTAKTGAKINWFDWNDYPGKGIEEISKLIESNQFNWDILDLFVSKAISFLDLDKACDDGLLVSFDFDKDFYPSPEGVLASKDFFTETSNKCLVGNIIFSWNYGYNTEVFSTGPRPSSIEDFFDTVKFPGKRGIYTNARTNLEIALLADGVSTSAVYIVLENQTGAVERAINKVKALCEDPNGGCIFWSYGSKPAELLMSKEVVMSTAWSNKLFIAEIAKKEPIKQVWNGQVMDYEYFAIVNGSSNQEEAMNALRYFTSTEASATLAKHVPYAPWRNSALDVIKESEPWYKDGKTNILPYIPSSRYNTYRYVLLNYDYWANYESDIEKKWKNFKKNLK
jgi:putative spermidine/putrescine transport system substrate-binding protein